MESCLTHASAVDKLEISSGTGNAAEYLERRLGVHAAQLLSDYEQVACEWFIY